MTDPLTIISGLIERVIFHHEETGFCILKVNVKGHKDPVTIVGSLPTVNAGEWIKAQGMWVQDRQYGQQFKAMTLSVTAPTTKEGIEKYLASGLIKGIGPVYAKKLVQAFGLQVFDIIETDSQQLQTIAGIGPTRQERIIKSWADQKIIRAIMLFLHSHGISTARAVRIYKTYGSHAIKVIQDNPYRLVQDIRGIGFITADKIAKHLGVAKDSLIRARAGITYALTKAMDQGHCGLPLEKLITSCQELLEIDSSIVQEAINRELQTSTVIADTLDNQPCIFLKGLYAAEKGIVQKIGDLLSLPTLPWSEFNINAAIAWVETQNHISLSLSQKKALMKTLTHKMTIITGGPGVGKTTLLRSLLQILQTKDVRLLLGAPTGRAAQRMSQATGFDAKTIHRLLTLKPETGQFIYNENSPLPCDVLVIDEVSMVDVSLLYALLKAVPSQAAVILVGDQDQLPSVGPGQVLSDLIACHKIPVIHLTETFRQASLSTIVSVARQINLGLIPKLKGYDATSDFFFIEVNDPDEGLKQIIELVKTRLPKKFGYSPVQDIQVLCPMVRGLLGSRTLNMELQQSLNPPSPTTSIQKFGIWFSLGDKVMQIENNYNKEIYNGDVGFIQRIDHEERELMIEFDGKEVTYDFDELDEIVLAYAMTIHKSQGSEYPVVIMPLFMQHYAMLQKNLVYTGITRGKKLVILIGQKKALAIAVTNKKDQKRWSLLKKHLEKQPFLE